MHESNSPTLDEISEFARRTLSRDESDTRPIPPKYIDILLQHLRLYPNETNFLMDLDDSGGAVTCLHCLEETLVGVDDKLPYFQPFWVRPGLNSG